jgi:hypothetical protein
MSKPWSQCAREIRFNGNYAFDITRDGNSSLAPYEVDRIAREIVDLLNENEITPPKAVDARVRKASR